MRLHTAAEIFLKVELFQFLFIIIVWVDEFYCSRQFKYLLQLKECLSKRQDYHFRKKLPFILYISDKEFDPSALLSSTGKSSEVQSTSIFLIELAFQQMDGSNSTKLSVRHAFFLGLDLIFKDRESIKKKSQVK